MTDIWQKINKILGNKSAQKSSIIMQNSQIITNPKEIANTFAKQFKHNSSNEQYTETFRRTKIQIESQEITINANIDPINQPITKTELQTVLKHLKNKTSPRPDTITNELIQHLPDSATNYLLDIYNKIWTKNLYPKKWSNRNPDIETW